jgi:hypothetical protein
VLVQHNGRRLVDQSVSAADHVIERRQIIASHGDCASAKGLVKATAFLQIAGAEGHVGTGTEGT